MWTGFLINLRMENKISWKKILGFFSAPFLLVAVSFLLLYLGVYSAVKWIDIPMHIIGGLLIGASFYLTLNYLEEMGLIKLNKFVRFVFVVSLVALFAVGWEFFEFSLTQITGYGFQGDLLDTMKDLFMGISGGLLAAFYSLRK